MIRKNERKVGEFYVGEQPRGDLSSWAYLIRCYTIEKNNLDAEIIAPLHKEEKHERWFKSKYSWTLESVYHLDRLKNWPKANKKLIIKRLFSL
jgi:hypothetical protein